MKLQVELEVLVEKEVILIHKNINTTLTYNQHQGNDGNDGTPSINNRVSSSNFDVTNIQNFGDPNSNDTENKNGAALIIWLWD